VTDHGYPDGCALVMTPVTPVELKRLESELLGRDAKAAAGAEMAAFWMAAKVKYPDLRIPERMT